MDPTTPDPTELSTADVWRQFGIMRSKLRRLQREGLVEIRQVRRGLNVVRTDAVREIVRATGSAPWELTEDEVVARVRAAQHVGGVIIDFARASQRLRQSFPQTAPKGLTAA
jgi:hypothetical protein